MKIFRFALIATLLATLVALVPSAQAAGITTTPATVTITEDQINASYWVTHPVRRSVTNKHVTLGDGTVTISATITHRDGKVFDAESIWKPYISNGILYFGFQSASVTAESDGTTSAASSADRSELILAHRYIIRDAIRDYIRQQVNAPFKYTSIAVTPGLITVNVDVYTKSPTA